MHTPYLISYTLSNKLTYDLQHCFVDKPVSVPKDVDVYEWLKSMHPDFIVYIENIAEVTEADFWDGDDSLLQ